MPRDFSIFHVIASQRGVHCYHYDRKDVEDVPSEYDVRKLYEKKGIDAITHFVVFNMWTGVVFLDPELEFVSLQDKQNPWDFLAIGVPSPCPQGTMAKQQITTCSAGDDRHAITQRAKPDASQTLVGI